MNRFKAILEADPRINGEGIQFSDGYTIVRLNDNLMICCTAEVQAAAIPALEEQGYRLEWMDPQ